MEIINYKQNGITFTEAKNDKNLKVVFSNLGAAIFSIRYDNYVMTRNAKYVQDFLLDGFYYGKTIGRVSNRMKGNTFVLNGERFEIDANENGNVLHGGHKGLSTFFYELNTVKCDDKIEVIYSRTIKDLEDGYPGNLDIEIKYSVHLNSNEIDIEYRAISDKDTVLSLTNHSYFTLGCKSLKGLTLQIDADNYLETDKNTLLPITRKFVNKALDFRNPKKIMEDIKDESLLSSHLNGYDHYFYFRSTKNDIKKLTLYNAKFVLDMYTNYQGVQIYTSGFNPGVELYPATIDVHDSVAIEPSDTFRYLHLLRKGEVYSRTIKYVFTSKE
ncbi:MAG: hypothetical protein J5955_01785 [Bacilli bacterium]|nr:hypothetical protein [Bacilli bacterium]